MSDFIKFNYFFECLIDEICDRLYEQGYTDDNLSEGLYSFIMENDDNFYSVGYYVDGYLTFSKLDLKSTLIEYMYSIYAFLYFSEQRYLNKKNDDESSFFDNELDVCDNVIISIMKNIPSTDFTYYEYFEKDGYDLVDNLLYFTYMKDTSKFYLSHLFEKDEEFEKLIVNNMMLDYLYDFCRTINVTEENLLIELFYRCCADLDILKTADLDDKYKKLKSTLILSGLAQDLKKNQNNKFFRHMFSVMINNIYAEIAFSSYHHMRPITKDDEYFFELMKSKSLSFNQIFSRFIDDDNFSHYVIRAFYEGNSEADEALIYARNKYVEDNKDYVKVKKFFTY